MSAPDTSITPEVATKLAVEMWRCKDKCPNALEIVELCGKQGIGIGQMDGEKVSGATRMLRELFADEGTAVRGIAQQLRNYCVDKARKSPLAVIREAMSVVDGMRAFMSTEDKSMVDGRHVPMLTLVEAQLVRDIRDEMTNANNANRTIIVRGPSGGGKTVALLSQSTVTSTLS